MFFITGMMGPYMRPMALNVPVTMIMSMVVAFTITPWLTYHALKHKYATGGTEADAHHAEHDLEAVKQSRLYKIFYPPMAPLLHSRIIAWSFMIAMGLLTVGAMALAAVRSVPLKMLPFDNKNELLLVLDFDKGTTLERSDAGVREFEAYLANVPEVADFTSYVGLTRGSRRVSVRMIIHCDGSHGRSEISPLTEVDHERIDGIPTANAGSVKRCVGREAPVPK